MLTWSRFAEAEPELASACPSDDVPVRRRPRLPGHRAIRRWARVHPMCPLIAESGLFAFLIPSPKRDDLLRDPRYAMHSFPAEENEDAFSLTGLAEPVANRELRGELQAQFLDERRLTEPPKGFEEQDLFAFHVERCLYTVTTGHGDPEPHHRIWRAP